MVPSARPVAFTSAITGLTPGTLYHVRAYATNDGGTSYGYDVTFTSLIARRHWPGGDEHHPDDSHAEWHDRQPGCAQPNSVRFCLGYRPQSYRGAAHARPRKALPQSPVPSPATSPASALGQTYYVRAYATNAVGTAYGEDVVFTTLASSSSTTTPATNARTGADVSGTGTGIWLNPTNITAADSNYASVTLSSSTSHYLQGSNYGFALPSNAAINGIQVTIGRYESGQSSGNDVRDSVVSLMKNDCIGWQQ